MAWSKLWFVEVEARYSFIKIEGKAKYSLQSRRNIHIWFKQGTGYTLTVLSVWRTEELWSNSKMALRNVGLCIWAGNYKVAVEGKMDFNKNPLIWLFSLRCWNGQKPLSKLTAYRRIICIVDPLQYQADVKVFFNSVFVSCLF